MRNTKDIHHLYLIYKLMSLYTNTHNIGRVGEMEREREIQEVLR